jgi:hypothetical protein
MRASLHNHGRKAFARKALTASWRNCGRLFSADSAEIPQHEQPPDENMHIFYALPESDYSLQAASPYFH